MGTKKQFALRLDLKLYDVLERWAADEFRSVNAHLEYLLRDAARRVGRLPGNRSDNDEVGEDRQSEDD